MHERLQREQGVGRALFIHDIDKVEGGLIVLFFGLVFFRCTPPENFLPTTLVV